MKKLEIWSWFISGFFRKHRKLIMFSSSIGVLFAIFAIWILPQIPRPNPVFKIGLVGQYSLDNMPNFILQKVSQGLTSTLKDGSVAPALAKYWTISDDHTVYTFFLRDNLFWQDKTQVKAGDLNYQIPDVKVKQMEGNIIRFELKQPYAPFLNLVSAPVLKDKTYGTGEYRITSSKSKHGYLTQLIIEGRSQTYKILFYNNVNEAVLAFKMGEIDQINNLYQKDLFEGQKWQDKVKTQEHIDKTQHVGLFFNLNDPFLKDKNYRQALAYAFHKPQDETVALGPISSDSWAYSSDIKDYNYNSEKAKNLLEKSFGSLEKAQENHLTISTIQVFLPFAEQIKNEWQEALEIPVDVQLINGDLSNYQILLLSQQIPVDPDQYQFWHSTQTQQNITGLNSQRIDKILEDARREIDHDKRKELYSDFQRYFSEELPTIFIKYPRVYNISRKSSIRPFIIDILNFGRGKNNLNTDDLSQE